MIDDGGVFSLQADIARRMGSEFMARLMEACLRQIGRAPETARTIAAWPGDRQADNIALRLAGALHALARREATPALVALYRDLDGDFDRVLGDVMAREDRVLAKWLESAPQTNEVGRSAAIWAAILVTAARHVPVFEVLELGSSAGLNLNLDLYGYDLGGCRSGDPQSPVFLKPDWRGAPPPQAAVEIRRARGVDVAPLDIREPASRERLLAFVWPDDKARAVRLERAIAVAMDHPPCVDRGDAVEWLSKQLRADQEEDVARLVFHSIVLQYLPDHARAEIEEMIHAAGRRATARRPLAWVAFEWDAARSRAALHLTTWPGPYGRELATSQAHAAWIDWRAD